jgi:hypothetical protein
MKTGYLVPIVVWTVAVIFGEGLLYNTAVYPRPVNERKWVDAESSISFRGLTPVKIGGCEPFKLESVEDATVLTPKTETPAPDSRCAIVAYRLEEKLTGKWRLRFYGATLVIAPQGAGSAVTVERGEAEKRTMLVMTIIAAVCLWAGGVMLFFGVTGRSPFRKSSRVNGKTK